MNFCHGITITNSGAKTILLSGFLYAIDMRREIKMRTRKNVLVIMMGICLLVGTLCTACGKNIGNTVNGTDTTESENFKEVTFKDDLGREVTVKNPKRVAALLGSYAHIWHLAGGTVVASADDAWEDFDIPLTEDAINLGGTKDLSLEKLFEANPDFIIASSNTSQHVEWLDTLEGAKLNVAYFEVSDFEDYLKVLKICTEITGKSELYDENGNNILEEINHVIEASKQRVQKNDGKAPKVLSLRASATWIRAKNSTGNVLGEMLKDLGCINIADSDDSLLENLNLEHIMQEDPDYIFICQQGNNLEGIQVHIEQFISDNPAWSNLTAVKEGRVYIMDRALYTLKPNNRWSEAYEKLEEILSN